MKACLAFAMLTVICSAVWADDTLRVVAQPLWADHYLFFGDGRCNELWRGQSDTVYASFGDTYDTWDVQDCFFAAEFPTTLEQCTGFAWGMWTTNLARQIRPWINLEEYPRFISDQPFEFPCRDHFSVLNPFVSSGDSGSFCAYDNWFDARNERDYMFRSVPQAVGFVICLTEPNFHRQKIDSVVLYWLVPDGWSATHEPNAVVPSLVTLAQNYPNPFNPVTEIPFTLPRAMNTSLRVYDLLGREVAVLANGVLSPGTHTARFGSPSLPSGVYIYRLEAGGQMETKKMVMMK